MKLIVQKMFLSNKRFITILFIALFSFFSSSLLLGQGGGATYSIDGPPLVSANSTNTYEINNIDNVTTASWDS